MLGNLKVLLAEDNEVNQLLVKSILRYWGLQSKIATTGFEVVKLLEQEDFDVILMDIQMPEKSGIEAAQEIRNMADPVKRNIPIIALTANALKGEERKYEAVGMDDFLTKPFKEADLYEVIERVLSKQGSFERLIAVEQSIDQTDHIKLYDFKQLEDISGGNKEFIISLVEIYLKTTPQSSSEMVQAAATYNWAEVSRLAHKLKSTIDSLNMFSIKQEIRIIELDAMKPGNELLIKGLVEKVDNALKKTACQLKQEFNL